MANAIHPDRCAVENRGRATLAIADEFLPRETESFTRPAPCNSVIYGVVGMQLFQFAVDGINLGGRKFSCRSRREEAPINFRYCSQSLMKRYGQDAKKCLYELNRWLDF